VRAHALRFETPLPPPYGEAAGIRVLVTFLVVGVGMLFALRFVFDYTAARRSTRTLDVLALRSSGRMRAF